MNKIWTPLFEDGEHQAEGKFLIIAKTEEEAIQKAHTVLENTDMLPHLLPYRHWTPFCGVRQNIVVDGILCL